MKGARAIVWILRFALGALLAYAGAVKLGHPADFATEIANYHLVPSLAPWLAVTLPGIELTLGLALAFAPREWLRSAALAAAGLLAVFTVAVTQVVARGINVSCGCFGGASGPVTVATVGRDLALLAAALALLLLTRAPRPSLRA